MKKIFQIFAILCLFFVYMNRVHAAIYASGDECQSRLLDGTQATQTCPIEFTVTGSSSKTFRVTIDITLVALNNPSYHATVTDSNWKLVKQEGNTFVFETTLSSLPVGTYKIGDITVTGATDNPNTCGGTYHMSFTPKCGSFKDGNNYIYYGSDGEETDQVTYLKQCFEHNCDVINVDNTQIYFNHEGEEITREQYAIYCNYHRSCGVQTDPVLNKKVYFNSSGDQTDFLTYITQCKNPSCNVYVDSNTNISYYYNSSGVKVTEAAYHEDCDEKPKCAIKDNKYYDNDGKETDELTYKRTCLIHNCDTIVSGSTTYYYDKNGNETDSYTYQRQCKLHNCDKVVDSNSNITYYYDKNGNEVSENQYSIQCETHTCEEVYDNSLNKYQYFGSAGSIVEPNSYYLQCKEHLCKSYKDVNTGMVYYYNNLGESVTKQQFEDTCGEKPSCGIVSNKYYDADGKEVDEVTYKKQCTDEYRCKFVESENKYYGTNSSEITKDEYYSICVKHTCDVYTDSQNKKHYYNDLGAEVTEIEQIMSCKPLICQTYEVGDKTYYFDNDENEVTKEEYESSCLEKPICKEENGKYFDKEGKEVKKEEYERSCKKYTCKKVDGKYYDSVGNVVSKEVFGISCDSKGEVDNPNTGASLPLRILAFLLIIGLTIYSFAVKNNKILHLK